MMIRAFAMVTPHLQRGLDSQLAAPRHIVDLSALLVLTPNTVPTLVHLAYRATQADITVLSTHRQPHRKRVTSTAGVAEPCEIHLTTEAALHALN